ncbi:hypothetical protein ABT275_03535 [Streptomyces sp. NPDC001185]|uniref:hypothetical protein n=1 Tax=Streptomyces sp. NPDC001185 TaxID=3154380 RepID=UPI00331F5700
MPRFRKKPVEIEALQFIDLDSYLAIVAWWKAWKTETLDATEKFEFRGGPTALLLVHTLEGWMAASSGDWIIRGIQGELYPCKPNIFAATYEAVTD